MFKVGDIITGTKDNKYGITNEFAVMIVTKVNNQSLRMQVEVIKHTCKTFIHDRFRVDNSSRLFRYYPEKELKDFITSLQGDHNA